MLRGSPPACAGKADLIRWWCLVGRSASMDAEGWSCSRGAILAHDGPGPLPDMTRRTLIAALLALLVSGVACSKSDNPNAPSPTPSEGPIFYTAIGASDGIGFGSSAPC